MMSNNTTIINAEILVLYTGEILIEDFLFLKILVVKVYPLSKQIIPN